MKGSRLKLCKACDFEWVIVLRDELAVDVSGNRHVIG